MLEPCGSHQEFGAPGIGTPLVLVAASPPHNPTGTWPHPGQAGDGTPNWDKPWRPPGKGLGWQEQGGAGSSHRLILPHRDPRDNPLPAPFLTLKQGWICISRLASLVNFYSYFVQRKLWRAHGKPGMLLGHLNLSFLSSLPSPGNCGHLGSCT